MEKNFIIAGFGGQGVLLAGEVLANAFMIDDKNVTWYPSYGAEMRGGTVNCEVAMASGAEVSSVSKKKVDFVIALNQLSFDKFLPKIKQGGMIIANSSLVKELKERADIEYIFAPISKMAEDLGNIKMANILSLGILSSATNLVSVETLTKALDTVLPPHRKNLLPKNIEALKLGFGFNLVTANV